MRTLSRWLKTWQSIWYPLALTCARLFCLTITCGGEVIAYPSSGLGIGIWSSFEVDGVGWLGFGEQTNVAISQNFSPIKKGAQALRFDHSVSCGGLNGPGKDEIGNKRLVKHLRSAPARGTRVQKLEPSRPEPSEIFRSDLNKATGLLDAGRSQECLRLIGSIIEKAERQHDHATLALAHELRARAMLASPLPETPTSGATGAQMFLFGGDAIIRFAADEWSAASKHWSNVNAVPEQIRGMAAAAFMKQVSVTRMFSFSSESNIDDPYELLEKALKIATRERTRPVQTARALNAIGAGLFYNEDYKLARRYLEAAQQILPSSSSLDLISINHNLALVASMEGRYEEAKLLYQTVLERTQRIDQQSIALATTLRWMARDALVQGRKQEADQFYQKLASLRYYRTTIPEAQLTDYLALFVCRRPDGSEGIFGLSGMVVSPSISPIATADFKLDQFRALLQLEFPNIPPEIRRTVLIFNSGYDALRVAEQCDGKPLMAEQIALILAALENPLLSEQVRKQIGVDPQEAKLLIDNLHSLTPFFGVGKVADIKNIIVKDEQWSEQIRLMREMELDDDFKQSMSVLEQAMSIYNLSHPVYREFRGERLKEYVKWKMLSPEERSKQRETRLGMSIVLDVIINSLSGEMGELLFKPSQLLMMQWITSLMAESSDWSARSVDVLVKARKPQEAWLGLETRRATFFRNFRRFKGSSNGGRVKNATENGKQSLRTALWGLEMFFIASSAVNNATRTITEIQLLGAAPDEFKKAQERLNEALALRNYVMQITGVGDLAEGTDLIEGKKKVLEKKLKGLQLLPTPLSLQEAIATVPRDAVYIAFSVGKEGSYVFAVRHSVGGIAVDVEPISLTYYELKDLISEVRVWASTPGSDIEIGLPTSYKLYEKLFPGVIGSRVASARRIILSPDGFLWQLPFGALVTSLQRGAPFLGEQKPVSLTESLSALSYARRPRSKTVGNLRALIIADPAFQPAKTPLLTLFGASSTSVAFASLEVTRNPASSIASMYNSRLLVGAAATERSVRKGSRQADVMQLFMHGVASPDRFLGMSSGLCLASDSEAEQNSGNFLALEERENDGVLQAWEVLADFDLNTEIVSLSGCDTAAGDAYRGLGVFGPVRSFQYAGARSVAANLWEVEANSTGQLMVDFHRGLRYGLAKDEALRQSIIQARKDRARAHPYYWAAVVLVGDPDNPILGVSKAHPLPQRLP